VCARFAGVIERDRAISVANALLLDGISNGGGRKWESVFECVSVCVCVCGGG